MNNGEGKNHMQQFKNLFCPPGFQYDRFQRLRLNQFINQCAHDDVIVEVGSRTRYMSRNIINLDIRYSPEVDIIADGNCLPFKQGAVAGVIIRGVLEHIGTPQQVMREIHRCLKANGRVYVEVPFIQGYHADPSDYQRYTLEGLELLCTSFSKMESGVCGGPASATAWILQEFLSQLTSLGNRWVKRKTNVLFGWICLPLKYLDYVMCNSQSAKIISSGFYFIGRKTDE